MEEIDEEYLITLSKVLVLVLLIFSIRLGILGNGLAMLSCGKLHLIF